MFRILYLICFSMTVSIILLSYGVWFLYDQDKIAGWLTIVNQQMNPLKLSNADVISISTFIMIGLTFALKMKITMAGRLNAVVISEEGGQTAILQTAINSFLRNVLKGIDGVVSSSSTIETHSAGSHVVEISAITSGSRPQVELRNEIRRIARESLTRMLGIPKIEDIHITIEKFADKGKLQDHEFLPAKIEKKEQDSLKEEVKQTSVIVPPVVEEPVGSDADEDEIILEESNSRSSDMEYPKATYEVKVEDDKK